MTILEACYLVLETTSLNIKNRTFVMNMGKPVNIYQVAKKLGQFKSTLDKNYKFKITKIGLKKNEKLHEILFDKKETKHKLSKNFFYVSRQNFDFQKFYKLLKKLENTYQKADKKEILKVLKKICQI